MLDLSQFLDLLRHNIVEGHYLLLMGSRLQLEVFKLVLHIDLLQFQLRVALPDVHVAIVTIRQPILVGIESVRIQN